MSDQYTIDGYKLPPPATRYCMIGAQSCLGKVQNRYIPLIINGYLSSIERLGLSDSYISDTGLQKSVLAGYGLEPHDITSLALNTLRNRDN